MWCFNNVAQLLAPTGAHLATAQICYSHGYSKCLTLMIKTINLVFPCMSLPSLLCVRDMLMSMYALSNSNGPVIVRERDMNNCYWEILTEEALNALRKIKDHIVGLA